MRNSGTYFLRTMLVVLTALIASQINATPLLAAVSHVVISQVQTNGIGSGTSNDEFVELYNPTNSSVNLAGWKLRKKSASQTGLGDNLVSSMSGTIAPHSYFLIAHPDYSGALAEDMTYTSTSSGIAATNNTVLLYNDTESTPIDKVAFGTAADFETAAAENPVSGGSLQRKVDDTNGHGLDTDNNSTDFEVLAVSTPRNSTTVVSTPTPSPTATPTNSPTASPTVSPTSTGTPTVTPTSSPIQTPTMTPTPSSTPTETPSPTPTPTVTPTPTMTASPTPTVTPTVTPTMSSSPSATPTSTPTSSPTVSPTPSANPGSVIGVFNFSNIRFECRVHYMTFDMGWFKAIFPSVICVRTF